MLTVVRFGNAALRAVAGAVHWFFDQLYGAVPAEFESAFDVVESVRRLSAVTMLFGIFARRPVAVGDVSREYVSLCKTYSFLGMDCRYGLHPYFKGEFCEIDGHVKLSGVFTLGFFSKVFFTVWFGFLTIWIGHTTYTCLLPGDPRTWWLPFAGLGMFSLGVAQVMVGKWFARDDMRWLSDVIEGALSDGPSALDEPQRRVEPRARINYPFSGSHLWDR